MDYRSLLSTASRVRSSGRATWSTSDLFVQLRKTIGRNYAISPCDFNLEPESYTSVTPLLIPRKKTDLEDQAPILSSLLRTYVTVNMDTLFSNRPINFKALMDFSELDARNKSHLKNVYSCLAIAMVAAAAGSYLHVFTGLLRGGIWASLLGIGLMVWLGLTPHQPKNQVKRLSLLSAFAFCTGLSLGPLLDTVIDIDPSIVTTAFLSTTVIFVCFSLSALWAKQRSMLFLGGILSTGLMVMLGLSLLNIFMGSRMLFRADLYLGLAIFCGFLLFDTQLIIEKNRRGDNDYIWHCLDLFLDFINIFRRILILLAMDKKEKRKK